jgi:hypothetical protein
MFPAEALARELLQRGHRIALITDRRGKDFSDRLPEVTVERVSASGVAGRSLMRRARSFASLAFGLLQARRIVARLDPELAVGFGSYASVPTIVAASQAGVPILLHEQNAVLGRANRMLAPRAAKIASSFPEVAGLRNGFAGKAVLTGNPVRPAIAGVGPYVPLIRSACWPLAAAKAHAFSHQSSRAQWLTCRRACGRGWRSASRRVPTTLQGCERSMPGLASSPRYRTSSKTFRSAWPPPTW